MWTADNRTRWCVRIQRRWRAAVTDRSGHIGRRSAYEYGLIDNLANPVDHEMDVWMRWITTEL
ncbi:hypothetical protein F01_480132 [Burkholderia cenocepacia]|nr:hypothetical protein F01_480132 [Burkholderia cenocepacia]